MKKIVWIIAILGLSAVIGGTIFGIVKANSDKTTLTSGGSVLLGEGAGGEKSIAVNSGAAYDVSKSGTVRLDGADGKLKTVPSQSFAVLDSGAVTAFSDGVLLNFDDLSENFINNYLVPAGMQIEKNGSGYMANTTNGSITFGDHLWKLSDSKYLIRSPEITVHFADGDDRQVKDYVQVYTSDDGIVHLLTPENEWTTISEECYIQTSDGTIIRPVQQRVEKGDYKISLAGLSVSADDNIELTEDEMRRQIVPEIKITTIDGENGESGTDGTSGEDGESGTDGRNGENGQDGTDGEDGAEGTAGTTGSSGSSGSTGSEGTKGGNGVDGVDAADGTPGVAGITGNAGSLGEEGEEGNKGGSGESGTSGTNGNKGTSGNKGGDGNNGIDGGDGDGGENGNKGETGGSGTKGSDASSITTTNSQIPAMSFGALTITDTEISGSILIDDPSKMLANLYVNDSELDKFNEAAKTYPGEVVITNNETGEQIIAYPKKDAADAAFNDDPNFYRYFSKSGSTGHTVYFGINAADPQNKNISKRLSPDTSYTIEVTAYYSSQSITTGSPTAYKRTFLSRQFYTDSSGLILTKDAVKFNEKRQYKDTTGVNEAYLNVVLADGTSTSNLSAAVYLLTPEQNNNFSLTTRAAADAYLYRYDLDYTAKTYTGHHGSYSYTDAAGTSVRVSVGNDTEAQAFAAGSTQNLLFVPVSSADSSGEPLEGYTDYVARIVINTNGVETLSPQELKFCTLKAKPYTQKHQAAAGGGLEVVDVEISDAVPSVNFNRVSGAFEVSKPIVVDTDSSITGYVYKAYLNGGTEPCATKEVTIGSVDPVEFFLATGSENQYTFTIEFQTFNGETDVIYETDFSSPVQGLGSTLPSLTFEGVSTFNSVAGKFTMSMGSGSSVKVDNEHPLWLEIYGDEKYENTILYSGEANAHGIRTGDCGNTDSKGNCITVDCSPEQSICKCDWWISTTKTYQISSETIKSVDSTSIAGINTNSIQFSLALKDLYENHKYTVKVSGYARVTEDASSSEYGNYQFMELGSFTFRTKQPSTVKANWTEGTGTTSKLDLTLKLTSSVDYEISEIQKGRVQIDLYEGTGTKGTWRGTKYVDSTAELRALTGADGSQGLALTDSSFGTLSLQKDAVYTVSVTQISDETYNLETTKNGANQYTNYFNTIEDQTKIITANVTPPDLTANPQSAVTVQEIKNKNLTAFGMEPYADLSDDAVVGYTLTANYDNSSHLGYKIKYYAFEYNDFYNCLAGGKDPLGDYIDDSGSDVSDKVGIRKLITMTKTFARSENTVPNVAVIFKADATEPTEDDEAVLRSYGNKKYYTYYVNPMTTKTETVEEGGVSVTKTYKQGMSRGYRYVFAYTMEYSSTETANVAKVYPYDHGSYSDYRDEYGIGYEGIEKRFTGVAYILNSGMQSAPKDAPEIHTYVTEAVPSYKGDKELAESVSEGYATLNYTYTDPDKTLKADTDSISYETKEHQGESWVTATKTAELKEILPDAATGTLKWETVKLYFVSDSKDVTVSPDRILPRAKYSLYNDPGYSTVLKAYGYEEDETDIAFGTVTTDYDWDGYMARAEELNLAPVVKIASHASDLNYIDFNFDMTNAVTKNILTRAYAATIVASNGTKTVEITKKLEGDGVNKVYVRIGTGELADLGTGSTTFSVKVIYDNGSSGWDLQAGADGFGIQLTKREDNGELSRAGYYTNSDTTSEHPYGGLFASLKGDTKSQADFEAMVNGETRQATNYSYLYSSTPLKRYIYPFVYGVDGSGVGTTVGKADGYLLTPKGVAKTDAVINGSSSVDVDVILPTLYYQDYESWTTSVFFRVGTSPNVLKVAGAKTAYSFDKTMIEQGSAVPASLTDSFYIVHCGLFKADKADEAKVDANLYNTAKGWYTDSAGDDRVIHLVFNSDGSYWGTCEISGKVGETAFTLKNFVQTTYDSETKTWQNLATIQNLNEEGNKTQNYYASFFMDFYKDGTFSRKILIDAENSSTASPKASYKIGTSDGVEVAVTDNAADYRGNNKSYFEKSATVSFGLSPRAYGITMMYDIYTTSKQASTDERDPNPYINLNDSTIMGTLLQERPTQLSNTDNFLRINLSPQKIRQLQDADVSINNLQPGKTYYLRLTAYASGKQQGYTVVPIVVKKSTFGVFVGMNSRTQDSISFALTVSDQEHVAMGFMYDDKYPEKTLDTDPTNPKYNNQGLYTVRFTDKNGKLIQSKYDKYVFSVEDLQQEFVLGAPIQLSAGTEYYINVFAVLDSDLDGLSPSVTGEPLKKETGKTWDWFFGDCYEKSGASLGINGWEAPNFTDLVDSLWDSNGNPLTGSGYEKYDKIRDAFLVEKKSRETAPAEGGINIPDDKIYLDAVDTGFQFTVKESYGVVTLDAQKQPVQGFDTIEWSIQSSTGKRYAGSASKEDGDTMFTAELDSEGELTGTFRYLMDLDGDEIQNGISYEISIVLTRNKTAQVAEYKKTYSNVYLKE